MKHVGFLIPASNIIAERELYMRLIKDDISDISFHFARLKFNTPYGIDEGKYTRELVKSIPEALQEMERINLWKCAVLCTSAEIFSDNYSKLIFPITSIISYLNFIKKSSPLIITPYNDNIGREVVKKLQFHGLNVMKEIHLNIKNKDSLLNYSNTKLIKLIQEQLNEKIDSICVFCTNFATLHLEEEVEKRFNRPFVSSNKAVYFSVVKNN